jgi:4-amino-4-deoxy-L-arabinose transferase-like glycosyltransferase
MKTNLKEKSFRILSWGAGPFRSRFSIYYMLILIVCLSLYYNYQEILFLRPQSLHQWRQCYGLSFTLNYYQDNNPLLQPALHFLGRDETGKTAGEFPILYYLIAKLWKIFGYHEFIFRLVNMIIFFTGLILIMKIIEDILGDSLLAIGFSLLLFTTPVLVYYANNFVPNIASLGFVFIAWYLFWLFYKRGKSIFLWISLMIFALAGLIKVTAIISPVSLAAILFIEATGIIRFKNGDKLFKRPLIQLIPFVIMFGLIFSWYLYANYYNRQHNFDLLAVNILPIWNLPKEKMPIHLEGIKWQIEWSYFHKSLKWFLLIMFAFILAGFRKSDKLLLFLTLLILIGMTGFVLLFFVMLFVHDYYVIDLYVFFPIVFLTFMCILKKHYPAFFRSLIFKILIVFLLFVNAGFTKRRIVERYSPNSWENENYVVNIKRFENTEPFMRSIGIEPQDKVLCLPDDSPIVTLYFMNQKGWTNYGTNFDSTRIKWEINAGADFLVIYVDSVYNNPEVKPFLKNKIGEINDISFYDISSFRTTRNSQALFPAAMK